VFKSEILFMARVHPFAPAAALPLATLERLIEVSLKALNVNVLSQARSLAPGPGRRTTGSLHPDKGLWVYGRAGEPCRRGCGARIERARPESVAGPGRQCRILPVDKTRDVGSPA